MGESARLVRDGFTDLPQAQRLLATLERMGYEPEGPRKALAASADPDSALRILLRLSESTELGPALQSLALNGEAFCAFIALLGACPALGEFLLWHPQETLSLCADLVRDGVAPVVSDPRSQLLSAVEADPQSRTPLSELNLTEAGHRITHSYYQQLCRIAAADVTASDPAAALPQCAAQLAELAGATVEAALAVSRGQLAAHTTRERALTLDLAVIGLGKCGAQELNYHSDVDLLYILHAPADLPTEQAQRQGHALAAGIAQVLAVPSGAPPLWELDLNLRPEGHDGPLVRTLDSMLEYYRRWACHWEFQALLKARPLAGNRALGEEFVQAVSPLVWGASTRSGFVDAVHMMRARVIGQLQPGSRHQHLKLGPGGLRDIEFTVQLLQLVHGTVSAHIRCRDTLGAIAALSREGLISEADAGTLDRAYRHLRVLEHRLQLRGLRRVHQMPQDEAALRILARSAAGYPASTKNTAEGLVRAWRSVQRAVVAIREDVFYRPILHAAARLGSAESSLSPEQAHTRLAALGYHDPSGAMRHLTALTRGVSRRAALQRQLLPLILSWLAQGADPDRGLSGFRRLSEQLGASPWFLAMLRDSPAGAQRLAEVLATWPVLAQLVEVSPEQVAWLGRDEDLVPRSAGALREEVQALLSRHGHTEESVSLVRAMRRRELLRIGLAEASGLIGPAARGLALTALDESVLEVALTVALGQVPQDPVAVLAVIAMGHFGAREQSYTSDVDVMFVYEPLPGASASQAQAYSRAVVERLRYLLVAELGVAAELPILLDLGLRPEGKDGALARSLDGFREYYERWVSPWEIQALLRARPCAADASLGERFVELIDRLRYRPTEDPQVWRSLRRLKARMEAERLPRGADPMRHFKLGRGGISDVEWTVQALQLRHAHRHPQLRTTSTLSALDTAVHVGLLTEPQGAVLRGAWLRASSLRAGLSLRNRRVVEQLPDARTDLEALARWGAGATQSVEKLEEDYLRGARQARAVMETVFYGNGD